MIWVWIGLYVLVNFVVFFMYGADKRKAKEKQWRTPEATLMLAAVFGVFGALLGMRVFRHKTKHKKFTIGVPLILGIELVLAAILIFR